MLLFETVLLSSVSKAAALFLKWLSRWFPVRPPLKCGRDYLPEESPLSYGELLQTKGKTTEKAYLLISQNIIRNDEGGGVLFPIPCRAK
jgi:hypothetical protein